MSDKELSLLRELARKLSVRQRQDTLSAVRELHYLDISDADFRNLCDRYHNILKAISSSNMDDNQLNAYLTSLSKKRDGGISDREVKVFATFWSKHRQEIRSALLEDIRWGPTLHDFNWRVEQVVGSRTTQSAGGTSAPGAAACFQLNIKDNQQDPVRTVEFAADRDQLNSFVDELRNIDRCIQNISGTATTGS